MLGAKPVMGWNSWNTFASKINEKLIMETADALIEKGYKDAGYEYLIIDDCWSLKERSDGKLVADPELFPHGMKFVSDYVHSKGLKFGMYSCAGIKTCAGYPSSHNYEYEDAKQFSEWGVDYLKYDFCNFPSSADMKNAYLTMAMALRNCGRDILFAACNWGVGNPSEWMRSRGAHTFRSTGDITDNPASFISIFKSQYKNLEMTGPGCFNDMDMLTVGMHGAGHVGLGGCSEDEYLLQFAMWAFCGSPLIIGGDVRNMPEADKNILLNKHLISINQDAEARPPFVLCETENYLTLMKILEGGKFAFAIFNFNGESEFCKNITVPFDDAGIRSNSGLKVKVTDAFTGNEEGIFTDGYRARVELGSCKMCICEIVK